MRSAVKFSFAMTAFGVGACRRRVGKSYGNRSTLVNNKEEVFSQIVHKLQRLAEVLECASTQGNAIWLGLIIRWCPVRLRGGLPKFSYKIRGLCDSPSGR